MSKPASRYKIKLALERLCALDEALAVASEVHRNEFWKRHRAYGFNVQGSQRAQAELHHLWDIVEKLTSLVSEQDRLYKTLRDGASPQ